MTLKVASFFAGIGGFDLGFERSGMEVVFQCEINAFCKKVLKKRWPNVPLEGDILELDSGAIPRDTDLWCGGFPCQDLSLANQGKRKGLQGERSGLFFRFAELVKDHQPRWVVMENVPGLLNSHGGEDFKALIQQLDELGYGVSWRILDAKYFGTPQRRRRVYVIGSYRSLRSAQVLFEPGPFAVAPRAGLGQRDALAHGTGEGHQGADLYAIQHACIGRKPTAGPQAKGYRSDGEAYTLDSRGAADAVCAAHDPFGVRATAGVSPGVDGHRYRAIGNAVCVNVAEWLGKRICAVENQLSDDISTVELSKQRYSPVKTSVHATD